MVEYHQHQYCRHSIPKNQVNKRLQIIPNTNFSATVTQNYAKLPCGSRTSLKYHIECILIRRL